MKPLYALLSLILLLYGCGEEGVNMGENYFLLIGNIDDDFDKIRVGEKLYDHFQEDSPVPTAGARSIEGIPFSFEVYFDEKKARDYTDYGAQIPLDYDNPSSILVRTNSDALFVYVTVHVVYSNPDKYSIECTYKEKAVSDSNTATVAFNLRELKNERANKPVQTTP